jgi:hypothetical protein
MVWIQLSIGLVAAAATLAAAWYAREAARSGRDAVEAARQTIALTAAARRADEIDRQRQRVERVGALVELVFWEAGARVAVEGGEPPWRRWMGPRNELRQALVGLSEQLPKCAVLSYARNEAEAYKMASDARSEVQMFLGDVGSEAF